MQQTKPALSNCVECGHQLSTEAYQCPKCATKRPHGIRCAICQDTLVESKTHSLPFPYTCYHRTCIDELYRIPSNYNCPTCGNSLSEFDAVPRGERRQKNLQECPHCGQPRCLGEEDWCVECGLPIYMGFQRSKLNVQKNGRPMHLVCAARTTQGCLGLVLLSAVSLASMFIWLCKT
jgi:DNA-directed RNA polymerase subunit RPC12/RpoP